MINDLFVRYTTALDAGDVETIVGCFTEDGALESPAVGVYAGRPGHPRIRRTLRAVPRRRRRSCGTSSPTWRCRWTGDEARATCYLLNVITASGKTELMPPGRYDCRLAKVGGQWLFRHRLVVLDGEAKLDGI